MIFKNKYSICLFVVLSFFQITSAQQMGDKIDLTGNLFYDSELISNNLSLQNSISITMPSSEKKVPLLAGLMSLVVPGAGEIYAGEYLKAGIFLAVEAAVITTAIIYDKKGNDQTDKFEKYADENWSVVKYAQWLNEYQQAGIPINPDESLLPWERVNWSQLNSAEKGSHKLPPHGDQQYYELIGKYHQYSSGWDDYNGGPNNTEVSPNFRFYSGERGKANDFYNVASKAVIGIYINHFLSALDAVWSTVLYNRDLAVKFRVEPVGFADQVELAPNINFRFSF